jgi:cytoskeleton protein RodZ
MTLEEFGSTLRNEREKRNLSIDDVSEILKISTRHLRALEEGDISALPHSTYIRGFLRSYASFLGFAAEEINSAFTLDRQAVATQIITRNADASSKKLTKSRAAAVILLTVVAVCAATAWKPLSTALWPPSARRMAEPSPPVAMPRNQSPQQIPPKMPAADTVSPQLSQENMSATPDVDPQTIQTEQRTQTSTEAATRSVSIQKISTHTVIITAIEECWIFSKSDDTDARPFSLQQGEVFALTFQKKLELKLGNAGGVRIRYDGQDMPNLGASGQVRTLRFPPQTQQE